MESACQDAERIEENIEHGGKVVLTSSLEIKCFMENDIQGSPIMDNMEGGYFQNEPIFGG